MNVWIVYDKSIDEIVGTYNAEIWNKPDIREDVITNHGMTGHAFHTNCVHYFEEVK